MKKIINLKVSFLVIILSILLSIGNENWFSLLMIPLIAYYFLFALNLFFVLYEKENLITKILFRVTELPLYLGIATVVAMVFLHRIYPEMSYEAPFFSAIIGAIVTKIGWVKRGKILKQPG